MPGRPGLPALTAFFVTKESKRTSVRGPSIAPRSTTKNTRDVRPYVQSSVEHAATPVKRESRMRPSNPSISRTVPELSFRGLFIKLSTCDGPCPAYPPFCYRGYGITHNLTEQKALFR